MVMLASISNPSLLLFFFNDTATTEIYTLSLHDALPILSEAWQREFGRSGAAANRSAGFIDTNRPPVASEFDRSEEHTSELQSRQYLVCRLLLEKKKLNTKQLPLYSLHTPYINRDPPY